MKLNKLKKCIHMKSLKLNFFPKNYNCKHQYMNMKIVNVKLYKLNQ